MSERQDLRETVVDLIMVTMIATIFLPIVYILDSVHTD